jgi:hypothetical protein
LKIDNRKLILQFEEKKAEPGEKKTKGVKSETVETVQKLRLNCWLAEKGIYTFILAHFYRTIASSSPYSLDILAEKAWPDSSLNPLFSALTLGDTKGFASMVESIFLKSGNSCVCWTI